MTYRARHFDKDFIATGPHCPLQVKTKRRPSSPPEILAIDRHTNRISAGIERQILRRRGEICRRTILPRTAEGPKTLRPPIAQLDRLLAPQPPKVAPVPVPVRVRRDRRFR